MNNKKSISIFLIVGIIAAGIYFFWMETSPALSSPDLANSQNSPVIESVASLSGSGISPEQSQLPTVTKSDCFALFSDNQTPDLLHQQQNHHLIAFFRQLEEKGYERNQLEQIGDVAELNKNTVSAALMGRDIQEHNDIYHEVLLPDNYDSMVHMPSDQRDTFDKLLDKNDYAGLIDAFERKQINPAHLRIGSSVLAEAINKNPQITINEIQSLLDAGVAIHLEAIVEATRSASAEVITYLAERYQGNLNSTWQIDDIDSNLTMVAASVFRDDLFYYFFNKGIPPYVANEYSMATFFDVMPEPVTGDQRQRALIYVEDAFKNGARMTQVSSLERLKRWLPDNIQRDYAVSLTPLIDVPVEHLELGQQLKAELDGFRKKIDSTKKTEQACVKQHKYTVEQYLEELLKGNPNSARVSLATKKLVMEHIDSLFKNEWKRMAATQLAEVVPEAILLANRQSQEANKAMINATFDKQWDKALTLCTTHPRTDLRPNLCSSLLNSYAGDENATWEFMEKILPHVDELSPYVITGLATKIVLI
ncbi:hypothetical protein [Cellvibrio sp. pealriver]|uniref:hypothetical protein n=1 Tax=Cellvibrio sp. pealriver TaxID=1622269 RepID=UPI00066FBDC2|nr:hypothetical protein [Cellvibrio sp. pealriver]